MRLQSVQFGKVARGEKVIESRLLDEKRRLISIGDEILISRADVPEETVTAKVADLYPAGSFEELFSRFPSELFGGPSKGFLLEEISRFYSKEEEEKHGVVGIRMEVSR